MSPRSRPVANAICSFPRSVRLQKSPCLPAQERLLSQSMSVFDYYPILVQIFLAVGIGAAILVASHLFGQRGTPSPIKDSPYECGMLARGSSHARFAVKFYITAMLFILFDIEIVFLLPWTLVFREFLAQGLPILLPVFFFLAALVLGLVYELKKGAIQWGKVSLEVVG